MLIGHNPAIQDLAVGLAGGASPLAVRKFPTGALATLCLTGPWRTLGAGHAELDAFVTPRELG
jgi:phosphohistidine phosphatase SixA